MKFTPTNLLPAGDADFETISAEEKKSSAGNDMIVLRNAIYQGGEIKCYIFDYLLELVAFKLRHYCQSTGLIEKYQSGELTANDCIGKIGRCKIDIQSDKDGKHPDKNVIKDYLDRPPEDEMDISF